MRRNHYFSTIIILFISFTSSLAREGMWLPFLLNQLNEQEMQSMGMKMTAEDIYSVNNTSLKDAVISFGGGCTGEIISADGLLLTNHHCGYSQIQQHSSVENDLLTQGFWAKSKDQELINPKLFVTFITRMEDVTSQVLDGLNSSAGDKEREAFINRKIKTITTAAISGTHYDAIIKPFFNENSYYMIVTETFRDIRLVGAPPSSIGKFGGDTDNWMWPRHTGDFSLFRIYAAPDGKPATFSKENIPYKPRHHFKISLDGIKEGDFTMIFGFPGRTTEYLPSFALENIIEQTNPERIAIRDVRLGIIRDYMKSNDTIRIKLAAEYARVANYWKKWIGENKGLIQFDAISKKKAQEKLFMKWANESSERKRLYGDILSDYANVYERQKKINLPYVYQTEVIQNLHIFNIARQLFPLKSDSFSTERKQILLAEIKDKVAPFYKNYNSAIDKDLFTNLIGLYLQNVEQSWWPASLESININDKEKVLSTLYDKSVFKSERKVVELINKGDRKSIKMLLNDPIFKLAFEYYSNFYLNVYPEFLQTEATLKSLNRRYLKGIMEMNESKSFYPDANSTLRVAYGKVEGYDPADGVEYSHFTTLEGIIEKEDPENIDFRVPQKLKELYMTGDYGLYGTDDGMPVCFIASNHTTGGNSGSPVINAEGYLLGINFDRNWEGTMSDIMYDPAICRNIAVDIRYVLFIIDKFAGAGHLVEEMTLVKDGQEVKPELELIGQ